MKYETKNNLEFNDEYVIEYNYLLTDDNKYIGRIENKEQAEFITKACNNYNALTGALKDYIDFCERDSKRKRNNSFYQDFKKLLNYK